ncbi:hypothetical protein [Diaphorobacter aerolatus]|uniref:hypothetical protein n=1 Tax=Diaphorobacter aerolatus TaxID=1288495 RepID=UPI001D025C36|nr:hypothetical protein [Diaphorobacter aerolatus]
MRPSRRREDDDDDDTQETARWNIPPFWQRLNSFFLFPFQTEPLIYATILALCSYLLTLGFFFSMVVGIGLMLAISRYAFKVAALASRGITDSADYRPHMVDDDWKSLPWKFFGVLVVHGLVIGWLSHASGAWERSAVCSRPLRFLQR